MSQSFSKQSPAALGDLPEEEFRKALHQVADWAVDYRSTIAQRVISQPGKPGDVSASLPSHMPEHPVPLVKILEDFERSIVPNLVHWGHPSFLGYFGSTTTAPGILGELMAATLNVSAMTWATSPAATELESVVLRWLRELLRLPDQFFGVVYDTASVATLHALAAARESLPLNIRALGLSGRQDLPRLRIYTSDQAHSSVIKAAITLGIGEANVRRVNSDGLFRMDLKSLKLAVDHDRSAGYMPLAVVATVGTTSSAAVDPIPQIAAFCNAEKIWLHVDAAYGGAVALVPEARHLMEGVDAADSVVVNPHKWLFVPLDFSALYTKHPQLLREVFSLVPEYLRGDAEQSEINYMDYGIQLGRRFRALKAWMVFSAFGEVGLVARIREHIRLARLFATWVENDLEFELLAPVEMGVVCFRAILEDSEAGDLLKRTDDFNRSIVKAVNDTGRAYLTHTVLGKKVAMRVGIGNVLTTEQDLRGVFGLIKNEVKKQTSYQG
ncbi:MAG TPA: pyridoxal-dependent decarboxylase [Pyrinomonadaceae bacterium]|nr:pyridoxal-dependent decarboxylase [Pyrinomonadaceae bacterium]